MIDEFPPPDNTHAAHHASDPMPSPFLLDHGEAFLLDHVEAFPTNSVAPDGLDRPSRSRDDAHQARYHYADIPDILLALQAEGLPCSVKRVRARRGDRGSYQYISQDIHRWKMLHGWTPSADEVARDDMAHDDRLIREVQNRINEYAMVRPILQDVAAHYVTIETLTREELKIRQRIKRLRMAMRKIEKYVGLMYQQINLCYRVSGDDSDADEEERDLDG